MERLAHLCEQWLRPLRARPRAVTARPRRPVLTPTGHGWEGGTATVTFSIASQAPDGETWGPLQAAGRSWGSLRTLQGSGGAQRDQRG